VLLWGTIRDIGRRLMDGVDPNLTDRLAAVVTAHAPEGATSRLRWSGHRLHVEVSIPLSAITALGELAAIHGELDHATRQALPNVGSVTTVPKFAQAGPAEPPRPPSRG
jgi:divalent metal cation (Fe/Co/Zn/Cd) transporter